MSKREWMLQAALGCASEAVTTGQEAQWAQGLGALYDAICAATPTVADEGWVEHDGDVSKAPTPESVVEYQQRDGDFGTELSADVAWDSLGDGSDVVRWRYV